MACIRNGIQFVRTATNRLKSFDLRCDAGKISRGSLPLDVKTRWNSTYLMLEQALKFRIAFDKMEAEDKPYKDYFLEKMDGAKRIGPPMSKDWDAAEILIQTLAIFYKSTLVLSGSNYVTSHKMYNETVNIARKLTALNTNPMSDEGLKKKAIAMIGKLKKYWDTFGGEDLFMDCLQSKRRKMSLREVIYSLCFF